MSSFHPERPGSTPEAGAWCVHHSPSYILDHPDLDLMTDAWRAGFDAIDAGLNPAEAVNHAVLVAPPGASVYQVENVAAALRRGYAARLAHDAAGRAIR